MYCACEHGHTGCMEQLCELKTKLAILRLKYDELEESSELISLADEDANSSKLIEDLINTLVSGLVSEEDFEEYKRQQSNRGYLTQIDPIYITEQELKEVLDSIFLGNAEARYKLWIYEELKDYVKKDNLSTYVAEYLRGHDITLYIDISRLVNQINSLFDNYYTKLEVDLKIQTIKITSISEGLFDYTPQVTSATPKSYLIGTLKLANKSYGLYGRGTDTSTGGNDSGGGNSDVSSEIEELRHDLDTIHEDIYQQVQEDIQNVFRDFDDFSSLVPWGEVFHQSAWSNAFSAYMQTVFFGVGDPEEEFSASWSKFLQSYNNIELTVKNILRSIGENGELNLESLQSGLKTYIDENMKSAVTELVSEYALTDNEGDEILNWLCSGFRSYTDPNRSFAQIFSATQDSLAAVRTAITDNNATGELAVKFKNKVAGVVATAVEDQSTLTLIADHIGISGDLEGGNATFNGHVNAESISLGEDGNIDINNGCFSITSEGRNHVAELCIVETGNSGLQDGNVYVSLSNQRGLELNMAENQNGRIGRINIGKLQNGDFGIQVTSQQNPNDNGTNGTGFTGVINGAKFVCGICVGPA